MTSFIDKHPGGRNAILKVAGTDATYVSTTLNLMYPFRASALLSFPIYFDISRFLAVPIQSRIQSNTCPSRSRHTPAGSFHRHGGP